MENLSDWVTADGESILQVGKPLISVQQRAISSNHARISEPAAWVETGRRIMVSVCMCMSGGVE